MPATGTINYQNIRVKANFAEDKWVVAAEMRPGNAKVVHHMRGDRAAARDRRGWRRRLPARLTRKAPRRWAGAKDGTDLLGKYNPGLGAQNFDVDGSAKFVPKGSDIVFNMHYTSVGTPTTDLSKVGLVFAKTPPKKRYWMSPGTPAAFNLVIPAGDSNAEVVSEVTVGVDDAKLVYIQPHMHLRGKDYEVRVIYPTGESETIFKGKWNFDWQLGYQLAKPLARSQGHADSDHRALRQFGEQQVQSGPDEDDPVGRSELGRDAVGFPGRGRRSGRQSLQDLRPIGPEPDAAREIGADAGLRARPPE